MVDSIGSYQRKQVILDRARVNLNVLNSTRHHMLEELYKIDQQILRHENLINELEQEE